MCLKIAERRGAILGTDSAVRFDVIQLRAAAAPAQSGADKILAALNRLAQSNGSGSEDVNTLAQ